MAETSDIKKVKFVGIDDWNRPIFVHNKNEFYGSVEILFSYGASEQDVLAKVFEKDLTYFGSKFGCEPMGSPSGNIEIQNN